MKTSKIRKLFQRSVAGITAALLAVLIIAGTVSAEPETGFMLVGPGKPVTIDMDIVSSSEKGLEVKATKGEDGANDASATVNGNVSVNCDGSSTAYDCQAVTAWADTGNASATVNGDVTATARYLTVYGLFANLSISGSSYKPSIYMQGKLNVSGPDAYGIGYYHAGTVTVDQTVDVTAKDTAYGVWGQITGKDAINTTVSGTVTVEGNDATGAYFHTSESKEGKVTANFGKDIVVNGTSSSAGLALCDIGGTIEVDVTGDITAKLVDGQAASEAYGIRFFSPMEGEPLEGTTTVRANNIASDDVGIDFSGICWLAETSVLVRETISATNYGVIFPYDAAEMDEKTALTSAMLDNYPMTLTAWKIETESGTIAAVRDRYSSDTCFENDPELELKINYIIKSEQPEAGGSFKLVNANGDEFPTSAGYPVAHVGEKIYIKPNLAEDYEIVAAYNGKDTKTALSKDGDQFYLEVQSGGGVYITVELAKTAFDIKFVDEDDIQLGRYTVKRGETPAYDGADPTKKEDAQYTYTFAGWTPEIVPATEDATYKATYTATLRKYDLTFDLDGGTLEGKTGTYVMTADYGSEITIPAAPTKEGFEFLYWEGSHYNPGDSYKVEGAHDFKAVYTIKNYTITWQQDDGTEIDKTTVEYGKKPTHADPTKKADAQYTYTFAGWTPEIVSVTGDATYKATYNKSPISYTITWQQDDGTEIDKTTVEYGKKPTHADPTKKADAQYTYTFAGWTPEIVSVTGDATYKATYNKSPISYTITWQQDDGTEIDKTTVEYGKKPTHADPTKKADAQYTYTFAGWTPEIVSVTGDATYKATYTATPKTTPPATGDSGLVTAAVLIFASLAGIGAILVYGKKRAKVK